MQKKYLFTFFVLFYFSLLSTSQTLKKISGSYEYKKIEGIAVYTYYEKDGIIIKHGAFAFDKTSGLSWKYSATGSYINNLVNGNWIHTTTWSMYNGVATTQSGLYFNRVTPSIPFIEITKKQIIPWDKGDLNGEESLIFTRKESWGTNGGGQKTTTYKKIKHWKKGQLQDFSFEIYENNIKQSFVKGKYKTLGGVMYYDGEWTGQIEGKTLQLFFTNGALISTSVREAKTGNQISNEKNEDAALLAEESENLQYIDVNYNDIRGKLKISKLEDGKYEFVLIKNGRKHDIPSDWFSELSGFINSVEKENGYTNSAEDDEWIANISSLRKQYLSNNRKRGDFWSIRAYDESLNKIFEKIDETGIDYIGNGSDFFTQNQENLLTATWSNDNPSYFNQSMYIKYLFYKGRADTVLSLFKQADEAGVFDDEDYEGWSFNSIGTMPFYFISICLAGDLNDATWVIQNNLANINTYKDGTTRSWTQSITEDIDIYLPFIQKAYPPEHILFLKNISNFITEQKNKSISEYFNSLHTVRIGSVLWMDSLLKPGRIGINPSAIRDREHFVRKLVVYGGQRKSQYELVPSEDSTLLILDNLSNNDFIKFNQFGWRLPTLKELKDLFARNLSDYSEEGFLIADILPMSGNDYVYINREGIQEFRFVGKDESGKLFVYNATKNTVAYPVPNSGNKISGLCKLVKAQ